MSFKDIAKLIGIYAVLFIFGTVLYIACFHTPVLAFMDVFFYRGIALIVLWGVIISAIMFILKKKVFTKLITVRDIILLFMAFCCINVVIFTHLPVTADRSITVFMLGYMTDNENESFTEEEIEEYFVDRYVYDYGAFEKRFEEQVVTGTIEDTGDGYRITDSGKGLMKIYEVVADWYNLDDHLIHSTEEGN